MVSIVRAARAVGEIGSPGESAGLGLFHRLTNYACAFTAGFAAVGALGELFNEPIRGIAPGLLAVLSALALLLGARRHRVAQRLVLVWGLAGAVMVSQLISGGEVFAIAAVLVFSLPFLLFHPSERKALALALLAGVGPLFLATVGVEETHLPVAPEATVWTRVLVSSACTIILGLLLWSLVRTRAQALSDAQRRAAEAVRAAETRSQFLAHMSHELRTPMTAILGWADLGTDPERAPEAIATIRRNGDHLLAIVNDILSFAKLEAGELMIELDRVSLADVVSAIESVLRVRATGKGIALEVEWSTPIPAWIQTDEVRLRQIMFNLVGNAVKFTSTGAVRIVIGFDRGSGTLDIAVEDDGVGIPADALEGLFDPFKQGERAQEGTGLGLPISRSLAQLLGGSLTVESDLGVGSTFRVQFVLGEDEHATDFVEGSTAAVRSLHGEGVVRGETLAGAKILIAEDYADNALLIGAHLQAAGAETQTADNGAVAVDEVRRASETTEPFSLVIMDMQMPVMDGQTATRKLRSEGFDLPVIALTAHVMRGERERCLAAGCNEYLAKPIDFPELLQAVAGLLDLDHQPRVNGDAMKKLEALRDTYRVKLPGKLTELENAFSARNRHDVERLAHGLAGAAGSYGFPEVSAAARALELDHDDGHQALALLRSAVGRATCVSDASEA